jgi:hypothetical protein
VWHLRIPLRSSSSSSATHPARNSEQSIMGAQLAATLSLSEAVGWAKLSGIPLASVGTIFTQFLLYFAVQYGILKLYRAAIYPHFFFP